ncbi:mitochondrial carrier homolog 2-like [Aethina tumida]|uniref:mitochondrial carrier homolog 2-like n=1 Tax=Aethina tumida TaxID=116153 RepID=UPI00214735A7|nr:mitochondrial carrier homolog 2-like [Aethina tumida]
MSERKESKWANSVWTNYALNIGLHPFDYAKVLIQLGYEPIPPRPARDFFGKPALKLPNIFQYVNYIRRIDGIVGCYRGLAPKLCGNLLSMAVTQKMMDLMPPDDEKEDETEEDRLGKFIKTMNCELVCRAAGVIVSQPFCVISVRIMAQFVGRETKYDGILESIHEIYKQQGLVGFFSGLMPRLLGDVVFVILENTLTYLLTSFVLKQKELQTYMPPATSFLATSVTYPFQVVTNCMIVNGSGLVAGSTKLMPHYGTWMECWKDLAQKNQLKRGSSFLIRYYAGQTISAKE